MACYVEIRYCRFADCRAWEHCRHSLEKSDVEANEEHRERFGVPMGEPVHVTENEIPEAEKHAAYAALGFPSPADNPTDDKPTETEISEVEFTDCLSCGDVFPYCLPSGADPPDFCNWCELTDFGER